MLAQGQARALLLQVQCSYSVVLLDRAWNNNPRTRRTSKMATEIFQVLTTVQVEARTSATRVGKTPRKDGEGKRSATVGGDEGAREPRTGGLHCSASAAGGALCSERRRQTLKVIRRRQGRLLVHSAWGSIGSSVRDPVLTELARSVIDDRRQQYGQFAPLDDGPNSSRACRHGKV